MVHWYAIFPDLTPDYKYIQIMIVMFQQVTILYYHAPVNKRSMYLPPSSIALQRYFKIMSNLSHNMKQEILTMIFLQRGWEAQRCQVTPYVVNVV